MLTRSLVATLLASLVLGSAQASQPEQYAYYHFGERVALETDVRRIAFVLPTGDVEIASQAVQGVAGLSPSAVTAHPIPTWWIAELSPQYQTPEEAHRIITELARRPGVEFTTPVLRDDRGQPLIISPYVLVRFDPALSDQRARDVLSDLGAANVLEWGGMVNSFRVRAPRNDGYSALELANALALRDDTRYAEPDMIFRGTSEFIPNDPGFPSCWGLHNTGQSGGTPDMDMDGPEAWDLTAGSSSVIVVIIDVGVQQDHPDLHQVPGADFTGQGASGGPVNQCDNHGTAVAGCVSAIIDNALGTVGIAPDARAASARTFVANTPCDGSWWTMASWTVDALVWATNIGAHVTNNSNSYGFTSAAIEDKYDDTRSAGIVHFASAGNDGSNIIAYPASLPSVNAVAALTRTGARASFSNFGADLAFSAPGVSIYSTDRTGTDGYVAGDYALVSGTSFAAPYTAGVAALVRSMQPGMTSASVESVLAATSVDLGPGGYDTDYGWGFINARSAVQAAVPPGSGSTVAYWDFHEGAGDTLHDVSGGGHHGVVSGATWEGGCVGGALSFDGDDRVVVAHSPDFGISSGTFEIIFRPQDGFAGGGNEELLQKERNGPHAGDLEIYLQSSGRLAVEAESGSLPNEEVTSDATSWTDRWYHAAYVFDGSGMRLYVNGAAQVETNPYVPSLVPNGEPIVIGYNAASSIPGDGFYGRIAAIRISEGTLTPTEFLPFDGTCVVQRGHCDTPEPLWFFDGNCDDQGGEHPCVLAGNATWMAAPGDSGIFTEGEGDYATYSPAVDSLLTGQIAMSFRLSAPVGPSAFADPIVLFNSNRDEHNFGDFSVRLEQPAGTLGFVQESAITEDGWELATAKNSWSPNVWYLVVVAWGPSGRSLKVSWDGGSEEVSDSFVAPCFGAGATERLIAARGPLSPQVGLTIDWLEVCSEVTVAAPEAQGAGRSAMSLVVAPNPARGIVVIKFAAPGEAGRLNVSVYDVTGRRVRRFRPEESFGTLQWDRSTDGGAMVGSGVYFVRLEGSRETATRRVVVTR